MTTSIYNRLAKRADHFATRCTFEAVVAVVANVNGVDAQELRRGVDPNDVRYGRGGAREVSAARQEAIYFVNTIYGVSLRKLGVAAGISYEAARLAIGAVEEHREDRAYDRKLDEIELALMGAG